jgi:exodeoxyribonuclease III
MKIATFNISGTSSYLSAPAPLAESDPDVMCLQKLKASQEKFPALRVVSFDAAVTVRRLWAGR